MGYMQRQGRKSARTLKDSGNKILEYPQIMNFIVPFCTLIMAFILFASASKDPEPLDASSLYIAVGIAVAFIFGMICIYIECKLRIEISEEGIISWSPWKGRRYIRWEEVKLVSFSGQFFEVKSSKKKVRVSIMLRGSSDFCREVISKVPQNKITKSARRGFDLLGL